MNIYAVLLSLPTQEELITKHCTGDCGKISIGGAIVDDKLGEMLICCEKECPYEKGVTDDPIGTSEWTGDTIYLRALQDHLKDEVNP